MKMKSGTAGKISSFIVPQICRYARLKVWCHPSPTPPEISARKSNVNEIGKPMKMTSTIASSITSPSASAKLIRSHLDLLVVRQEHAGPPRPQALHELGDALHEQQ